MDDGWTAIEAKPEPVVVEVEPNGTNGRVALVIAKARRRREEQSTRADLEALVNTAPVGVLVFDARTSHPVSVNREARRMMSDLRMPDRSVEPIRAGRIWYQVLLFVLPNWPLQQPGQLIVLLEGLSPGRTPRPGSVSREPDGEGQRRGS